MAKKKQNKVDWRIVCVGIICITSLEIYALSQGINGTLLKLVLMVIAGGIGLILPNPLNKIKEV